MTIEFNPAALDEIAACLVTEEITHSDLTRKFAELNISEPIQQEPDTAKKFGLQRGVDYWIKGPSKRERLLYAIISQYKMSGGQGVLQIIRTLYSPVSYVGNPGKFREFCGQINPVLRFSGVEYRDDGKFYQVSRTKDLSEAERRAKAVENKMTSRRVHSEVQRYCKAEYMEEDYFQAVLEAAKGLAERIREKTGLTIDGVNLARQSFDRPKNGYPKLAFNSLRTDTERNEHDGFKNLLIGSFQFFRNPMSHTPKVKWEHGIEDAVDCLTLISCLNFRLEECYPTS